MRQPYAYAIVAGLKTYETRSRRTSIRERVAIHAAKQPVTLASMSVILVPKEGDRLHYGAVLGTVEIAGCLPVEEILHTLSERERLLGDFSPGRWAWVLKNPVMFDTPVPARGNQGWWDWTGPCTG